MNLEILNMLLEANLEMPSKGEILRRFRTDFAARLAYRLNGTLSAVPNVMEDEDYPHEGRFVDRAELGVRAAEEPAPVPDDDVAPAEPPPADSGDDPAATPEHYSLSGEADVPLSESTADRERPSDDSAEGTPQTLSSLIGETLREEAQDQAAGEATGAASPDPAPASEPESGRKGKKKKRR
ncbi:MAG: hypothetical protein FJ109_07335 [Deltaproteobacteria bacterium]|nr:hypothetical protein [Deltaproteobacteria bacterium]